MYNPLISVIIVVYNACTTIEAAIKSVLSQVYNNKELVIIDGGSNDGTLEILKKYSNKFGYFISEQDEGIYDAMNKGIKAAKGDWLYFLGSDDILFDKEVFLKIFSDTHISQTDFIYGNVTLKSNNKVLGGSRNYKELIKKNISHQAIFYEKEIFKKIGDYNLRYNILADYDFNLRVFQVQELQKKYKAINVCLFNDKGGASNITIDSAFFLDKLSMFTKCTQPIINKYSLQQYYFYAGFVLLMRDKKIKGLAYCFQSFISGPRKIFYSLVFAKYILGYLGLGKKIKIL